jgi:hypothetical protein
MTRHACIPTIFDNRTLTGPLSCAIGHFYAAAGYTGIREIPSPYSISGDFTKYLEIIMYKCLQYQTNV